MNPNPIFRSIRVGLALALLLVIGLIAGCTGSSSSGSSSSSQPAVYTAQHAYNVAMSTLSTTAPDGKLLVVQSAAPITPTSTPTWDFLIGSPKTDTIYAVEVAYGQGKFQEYGKAGLTAQEWASVPATSTWKIDSDVAHEKAVAVHAAGKSADYIMGFVTYVPPKATTATAKPMTWLVSFDPQVQGSAPTSTVGVDLTTGAAAYATK